MSISNIDKENIYHATQEGMEQILRQIRVRPQVALVDAMHPHVEGIETVPIIHGDALSASIAAASVVAKVTRDHLMLKLSQVYPQYGLVITLLICTLLNILAATLPAWLSLRKPIVESMMIKK